MPATMLAKGRVGEEGAGGAQHLGEGERGREAEQREGRRQMLTSTLLPSPCRRL